MSKETATPCSRISLVDGIVVVRILENVDQTLEMARENLQAARDASEGQQRPILLDLRKARPLPSHVRRYYIDQEILDQYVAIGMLVERSPFGTSLGNFYLKVADKAGNKKLFHDETECKNWLKTYLRP
jgi:hypothetical protein